VRAGECGKERGWTAKQTTRGVITVPWVHEVHRTVTRITGAEDIKRVSILLVPEKCSAGSRSQKDDARNEDWRLNCHADIKGYPHPDKWRR
jgi:hypothetical protein